MIALAGAATCFGQTSGGAPQSPPRVIQDAPLMVLSPKAKAPGWTGVHRPHTKLADVLARHEGKADWAETVVDDESLFAQWISMGPTQKTPRQMNGDTREWWIVQSGSLKFTVEGREPVVATKGFMVQVPFRTLYQIENVGDTTRAAFRGERRARAQALSARREAGSAAGLRLRPDDACSAVAARSTPITGRCSTSRRWCRARSAAAHS